MHNALSHNTFCFSIMGPYSVLSNKSNRFGWEACNRFVRCFIGFTFDTVTCLGGARPANAPSPLVLGAGAQTLIVSNCSCHDRSISVPAAIKIMWARARYYCWRASFACCRPLLYRLLLWCFCISFKLQCPFILMHKLKSELGLCR